MRNVMKSCSGSPPVHVHVTDATPVHVHVKTRRRSPGGMSKMNFSRSAKVQTPGKASYRWEGPTHRLEIPPSEPEPEQNQSLLRLSDLTSEEEEGLQRRTSQRKMKDLMTDVSSLRTELLDRESEELSVSRRLIGRQGAELTKQGAGLAKQWAGLAKQGAELTKQGAWLVETEKEKPRLLRILNETLADGEHSELDSFPQDNEVLIQKLQEAEAAGAAAALQVSSLKERVYNLRSSDTLSSSGLELLLGTLERFEATNQSLRLLLREQKSQTETVGEQRDVLQKKLADTRAENALIVKQLQEKHGEIQELCCLLESEKENAQRSADLSRGLESTRARMQGRLRSREAENNRLSVQIKNLERAANHQRAEMHHVTEQLSRTKQEVLDERDNLKRAARAQKQRAERSEGGVGQLSLQLLQTEKQLAEALSAAEAWQRRHADEAEEKRRLEADMAVLNSHISELTEQLQSQEVRGRGDREALLERLQAVAAENAAAVLENQNLKAASSTDEERLSRCQSDLLRVRTSARQQEALLDGYKIQVGKTQAEADQYRAQAARAELEARSVKAELEAARGELLGRLTELEALPEVLRHRQDQLQEVRDQERSQERRKAELSTEWAELHLKMETQERQMDHLRQKNSSLMEENRQLQLRAESLQRTLGEVSSQNCDLLTVVSKREETIHSNQRSLEEKTRECSLLSRRLEEAVDDARRQSSETRERGATRERCSQATILDLQSQVSRTASELDQLRLGRAEAERRYQSRLRDLEDRLQQSDRTNRSLQNYVQFLKASYSQVFSGGAPDGPLGGGPSPV